MGRFCRFVTAIANINGLNLGRARTYRFYDIKSSQALPSSVICENSSS